jgi:hypothetical protein
MIISRKMKWLGQVARMAHAGCWLLKNSSNPWSSRKCFLPDTCLHENRGLCTLSLEDGGNIFFRNIDTCILINTASKHGRTTLSDYAYTLQDSLIRGPAAKLVQRLRIISRLQSVCHLGKGLLSPSLLVQCLVLTWPLAYCPVPRDVSVTNPWITGLN